MAKMGMDYAALCKVKPDIILLSASAFGQYGPYRERPGFDPIGQAMSGLMMLTGQPVGQPLGTASSIVDRYTALHLTIGALAALRHRDLTGEGQEIDVCLMDSALTMVEIPTSYYLSTGQEGGEGGARPTGEGRLGHHLGQLHRDVPKPAWSDRRDRRARRQRQAAAPSRPGDRPGAGHGARITRSTRSAQPL